MTPTLNNSKPRKSLADQLNRLDKILDGMAEGLSEAVSDSVRDAVAVAVKQAITDVLTNPELLKRLQEVQIAAAPAQSTHPKQPILERVGQTMAGFWNRTKAAAKAGCQKAKVFAKASCERVKTVALKGIVLARAKARIAVKRLRLTVRVLTLLACGAKRLLWPYRKPVLLAAGVGAVIGLCCYFAWPYMVPIAAGASCGVAAGAAAEWLPWIDRIIARRRMMTEAIQT